jgi:outer membrane lipoprotein SlyB
MNRFAFKCALLGVCLAWGVTAVAQTTAPAKTQLTAQNKAALARYDSDKKLCNDEASSTARLQCRRDAKAEYDKALAEIKASAASAAVAPAPVPRAVPVAVPAPASASVAVCAECGRVIAVSVTEKEGEGSALGLLGGGAAGALLGHQVGSGTGRTLATVAGALGGAYAGKKIEEKVKTHKVWIVSVQYDEGGRANFEFDRDPGLRVGDAVRKSGDTVLKAPPP